MTNDEVHSALVRWLHGLTGLVVIKAYQEGPRPALPYVMVNLTGVAEVREWQQGSEYDEDTAGVTASVVIETEWRFSVHAFGSEPTGILRPVVPAAQSAQKMEPLYPSLIVHECSQVRSVPELINEKWEPRAQMDLFLRGLIRDGFLVDVIEEAPIHIAGS
jgi:hypothetical protein